MDVRVENGNIALLEELRVLNDTRVTVVGC